MQYRSEFYTVNRQKIFFIALIEGRGIRKPLALAIDKIMEFIL